MNEEKTVKKKEYEGDVDVDTRQRGEVEGPLARYQSMVAGPRLYWIFSRIDTETG